MSQYASRTDLFAAMIARITELESQLAQRFDAADMATAAQAVVPPNAIAASIMRHDGGEAPVFRLMAAYRSEKDAMDAFTLITAAPAQPAAQQPHGAAYAALPECLTCSDHGAVGNILTAEPCPDCTRLNDQPAPATQQAVDAARKQGEKQ